MTTNDQGWSTTRATELAQHWFPRLVLATIVAGYLLIVVGGIVRVSGSGLGCGTHWPDCNGAIVPTFSLATAIEYTHRMIAALVVVLTLGLVATGFMAFRSNRRLVGLPVLALGLVLVQAVLGALTVEFDLPPSVVMAHLGTAELYFAALIVLGVLTFRPRFARTSRSDSYSDRPRLRWLAPGAAGAVFVLMLVGAYTATSGAGYACTEWPLCNGHYLPTGWTVIDIQLLHRTLALVTTVVIVLLAVETLRYHRRAGATTRLVEAVVFVLPVQILLGAANIWFKLAPAVSALHLATATLLWGLLVTIVAIEYSKAASTVGTDQRQPGVLSHARSA